MSGGDWTDTLNGGSGDDIIGGGSAADVFVYDAAGFGADQILDWEDSVDLIRFTAASGVDDISDLTIGDDGSGNALITAPDGSTITLAGIDFNTLDSGDFIFGP